jgi:hypothetical protein
VLHHSATRRQRPDCLLRGDVDVVSAPHHKYQYLSIAKRKSQPFQSSDHDTCDAETVRPAGRRVRLHGELCRLAAAPRAGGACTAWARGTPLASAAKPGWPRPRGLLRLRGHTNDPRCRAAVYAVPARPRARRTITDSRAKRGRYIAAPLVSKPLTVAVNSEHGASITDATTHPTIDVVTLPR